jgi:hypothetical protein
MIPAGAAEHGWRGSARPRLTRWHAPPAPQRADIPTRGLQTARRGNYPRPRPRLHGGPSHSRDPPALRRGRIRVAKRPSSRGTPAPEGGGCRPDFGSELEGPGWRSPRLESGPSGSRDSEAGGGARPARPRLRAHDRCLGEADVAHDRCLGEAEVADVVIGAWVGNPGLIRCAPATLPYTGWPRSGAASHRYYGACGREKRRSPATPQLGRPGPSRFGPP